MPDTLLSIAIAAIAAVPPTLASVAALRRAKAAALQVRPSNGTRLAELTEGTRTDVREIRSMLWEHVTNERIHR